MKKYIILFFTTLAFTFTGCESDTDPGGTAVQKMAGDWWITVKNTGNPDYEGEYGPYLMYTYNTAANNDSEMWLQDNHSDPFWDYKLKVNVNYNSRTFETADFVENIAYDSKVKITEGKITEGAATTPSGMPADKIEYKIQFDDDGFGGTVVFEVTGFRRTGFPADDF